MEQQHSTNSAEQHNTTSQQATKTKTKKSGWRWFWRSVVVLGLVIVATIAFLATGKGQRLAVGWIADSLEALSLGGVEGSLQDGLHLTDLRYQMEGVEAQIGQADLHIGFQCLLNKQLCIENIALKESKIWVDTSKLPQAEPKAESASGEISFPLPVSVKQVVLDQIEVVVDEKVITLDHFHTGVVGEGKHLTILPTTLEGLRLSLPASAPQAVSSEQDFATTPPPSTDWAVLKQQLSQPLLTKAEPIKLPLYLQIPQFSAKNIQVEQRPLEEEKAVEPRTLIQIASAELAASTDEQSVRLEKLTLETDKGNVEGKGQLNLTDNYPLDWQLRVNSPDLPEFKLPASQANLTLSGELFGEAMLKLNTSGAAAVSVEGNVALAEPRTPFSLAISSKQIQYPFIAEKGSEPLKLNDLTLSLAGDLLDYQLDGNVALQGMNLPTGDIAIKGQGGLTEFELSSLNIRALQGKANVVGRLAWDNGVAWSTKMGLDNLHTSPLLPEWRAILTGEMASDGYVGRGERGEQWAANVSKIDLKGRLFNKPLQLKGSLNADHNTLLNVAHTDLIYGENKIALKGVLGEQSDFSAQIDAPNLQGLVPNLKASLKGDIRLNGNISAPELDLNLVAHHLRYAQTQLQHLTAKGKITTDQQIQGDLAIALKQFSHEDIQLEQVNVTLSGSEQQHQLKLTSSGTPVAANLQIVGKFDRLQQQWQGMLSDVRVKSPVGQFQNDKDLAINYHHVQSEADISAHCWRNPKLTLCFPEKLKVGKEGKLTFNMTPLDLTIAQDFLDKNSQISGSLSAKGDVEWFSNKSPIVNVDVTSNGIKFAQKIDYRTFPLHLKPVRLKVNLSDDNLRLNSDIQVENNGRLVSDILIKDVAKSRSLSGSLQLEKFQLSLIKPLLNQGEKVSGNLNAYLTLGGTAYSPQLFGDLNLTALKASSKAMPFEVTNGHLALAFNGNRSTLTGNVQTKESNLLLAGEANWQNLDAWQTRISAQAERFRIDVPGIAKVDVSPDIEVKANPRELVLTGQIDIPWARIAVEELPESAITVSGDEVIMEGSLKEKLPDALANNLSQNSNAMAVKADVSINIGYDPKETVHIDAYGFNSNLQGRLKVRQGRKGLGLYGQVNILKGKFASFGQDLIVRKGIISFTGLPSQPTLDVEAIRNPEAMEDPTIVAGVKVTGIADSPEVKIFSNPPMPQDQALSYILTGRSLESSGDGSSSNSIAAALIGMSLSKSSKMVGGVGSAFGINDLNVTTAGIGDNTKVVVSGSLSPKFKVKYGVGLFAPLTELTLRYRLAPSLYLQWISSINQAVDLMYRFEFD